jgi:hypothetical protein
MMPAETLKKDGGTDDWEELLLLETERRQGSRKPRTGLFRGRCRTRYMCSFRMIGDTRQNHTMKASRWDELPGTRRLASLGKGSRAPQRLCLNKSAKNCGHHPMVLAYPPSGPVSVSPGLAHA